MSDIEFLIEYSTKHCLQTSILTLFYNGDCCWGEVIRNICVNGGIDPDTENGITKNIKVFLNNRESSEFHYDPLESISTILSTNTKIIIVEI